MIKSLRWRFVLIAMAVVCVVTAVVVVGINVVISRRHIVYTDQIMEIIAKDNADFSGASAAQPNRFNLFTFYATEESAYETRWFTVLFRSNEETPAVDVSHIAAVSAARAEELARKAVTLRDPRGLIDKYKYRRFTLPEGLMVVFLDPTLLSQSVITFRWVSALVALISWLIIFAILCLISERIVRPVEERIARQRRFITDAGHELKTPLAIISANADVIRLTVGDDEWLKSIRAQVLRMNGLVSDLLTLSRIDEDPKEKQFAEFDLSALAEKTAKSFSSLFAAKDIRFDIQIEPALTMLGNEQSVAKLLSVLAENAAKYTPERGWARLFVCRARREVRIGTENTVSVMPEGDLRALFGRFYRADASRSREKGGSGIGLSIAKSVAEQHGGRIGARRTGKNTIMIRAEFRLS